MTRLFSESGAEELNHRSSKYHQFVERLYMKCQEIQLENERLVYRLAMIKNLTKKRNKDVALLKNRLDKHKDDWRHVPMVAPHRTRKTELKRGPKQKAKQNAENKVRTKKTKKKDSEKSTKQKANQNLSQN